MQQLLLAFGRWQRAVSAQINSLPMWAEVTAVARAICAPLVGLSRGVLRVFPALRRLEWMLEIEALSRRHPVPLVISMLYVLWRGLHATMFGHIGTDPMIYPFLAAVSGFNPFLGLVCGAMFGVGDLIQKLYAPDMFGAMTRSDPDYWYAMRGYVVSYSSTMWMGLFPGVVSRVCRQVVRSALSTFARRRAAAAADGAVPGGGAVYPLAELVAGFAGAYGAAYFSMDQVLPQTEKPAFMWRPTPDDSCHRLEVSTYLTGRAGAVAKPAGVSGAIAPTFFPPVGGSGGPGGAGEPAAGGSPRGGGGTGGEPIVDPWSGKALTAWRPGAYGAGEDGNPGGPGMVWWGGNWVDPQTAREKIDEALRADERRARESREFFEEGQRKSEQFMQQRVNTLQQEVVKQKAEAQRQDALATLAGQLQNLLAGVVDPARREHLENLFNKIAKPDGKGGYAGDPGAAAQAVNYIRGETFGASNQRTMEAYAATVESVDSAINIAQGVRTAAIRGLAMGAGAVASPLTLTGALIQAGMGGAAAASAGSSGTGIMVGAATGAIGAFLPGGVSVGAVVSNAAVGGVSAWAEGADARGVAVSAVTSAAFGLGVNVLAKGAQVVLARRTPNPAVPPAGSYGPGELGAPGSSLNRPPITVPGTPGALVKAKAGLPFKYPEPVQTPHGWEINERLDPHYQPGAPPGVKPVPQVNPGDCWLASIAAVHPHQSYEEIQQALKPTIHEAQGSFMRGYVSTVPYDQLGRAIKSSGLLATDMRQVLSHPTSLGRGMELAQELSRNPGAKVLAAVNMVDPLGRANHVVVITGIRHQPGVGQVVQMWDPAVGHLVIPRDRFSWDPHYSYMVHGVSTP